MSNRPDWAAIAGQSVAAIQEVEKYLEGKLPYLMRWLQEHGETPANERVAKAVFKRKYRDRIDEFRKYYEAAVAMGGDNGGVGEVQQEASPVASSPSAESEVVAEPTRSEGTADQGGKGPQGDSVTTASSQRAEVYLAGGDDPFVGIFAGGIGVETPPVSGIVRVAALDRAEPADLRRVQAYLLTQMQAERLRPAVPREDYVPRTYKLPPEMLEELKRLGSDVRFGRLGVTRLVRAALATVVYCVDEKLPVYRNSPVLEAELLLGVARMDHSGNEDVGVWVHTDLVSKVERICDTAMLFPSDLAVMGVEQLLAFVKAAQAKVERRG